MLTIAEPLVHPADDVTRNGRKEFRTGRLISVDIVLQEFGVVVAHFLEVRHHPALVHRIAMEPAGELIVDAAVGHAFQRGGENFVQFFIAGLCVPFDQQVKDCRVRKFGCLAEASVCAVEHLESRLDDCVDHARGKLRAAPRE